MAHPILAQYLPAEQVENKKSVKALRDEVQRFCWDFRRACPDYFQGSAIHRAFLLHDTLKVLEETHYLLKDFEMREKELYKWERDLLKFLRQWRVRLQEAAV